MKKTILLLILALLLSACAGSNPISQVAATTLPVYEFTLRLCQGTDITVTRLVTESVSCLHDYSLQVHQMRAIEGAQLVILSGAGLEAFLQDALVRANTVTDASQGVPLIEETAAHHDHDHDHSHEGHHHEQDPHIWLDPQNAKMMAENICSSLCAAYPHWEETIHKNLDILMDELDTLQAYGDEQLSSLSCRELITFHDGFSYLAQAFDLTILESVEEESGSEASAAELIHLIQEVEYHHLPAIFTEINGSSSAANIIAAETGCAIFSLDMAMSEQGYFEAMYHNIDTIKEALG